MITRIEDDDTAIRMTDNDNKIIQCPSCKTTMTVDELGEHVNANPETKKQAIEEQLELWGEAYSRNYLIQNIAFCPKCAKISYLGDWASSKKIQSG